MGALKRNFELRSIRQKTFSPALSLCSVETWFLLK
jgi:hypothetical protein